jgi:hypothetical protein
MPMSKCDRIAITVNAPPTLTATLDATVRLLYGANPATWLSRSGGVGPFTYALDGNAAFSSASTTVFISNVTQERIRLVNDKIVHPLF